YTGRFLINQMRWWLPFRIRWLYVPQMLAQNSAQVAQSGRNIQIVKMFKKIVLFATFALY
ncbi:hypothetical protein, partial [Alkalicoccus saliphilus]|uniref:hypothetical protein n=1 Tax=Alkalicoccus saliphilus TaxID=200989 RepID=UPI001C3FBF2C